MACAFLVLFMTYGVQYSFGVFLPPMLDDLGWQRASLGGAFSLYTMVYMSLSLVSGRLTDTLGPRRVVGIGGLMLGLGIIATSQMTAQWHLYLFYGIIAAIGMSTAYIPCNATVVRWFDRQRGLALGIVSCGASCGILVVPTLASFIIIQTDWRAGLLILGFCMLIIITITARFMVRSPELMGLQINGRRAPTADAQDLDKGPNETGSWNLPEARKTFPFWLFLAGMALAIFALTVPFVHLPVFARDIGLSTMGGSIAISITGLFSLFGSFGLGILSDRIGPKRSFIFSLCMQLTSYLFFLSAKDAATLYLGAAAFGISYGGIASMFPALVGHLYGRPHAGAIGGFIFGGAGILGAWGPAVAGYLRDIDGDYKHAFILCALTGGCSIVLLLLLPRPRQAS